MLRLLISFTLWLLIHGSCTPEDLSIITIGVAYDTRWKKAYGSSSFQVINETINQANEILESSLFIRLRIGEVYYWNDNSKYIGANYAFEAFKPFASTLPSMAHWHYFSGSIMAVRGASSNGGMCLTEGNNIAVTSYRSINNSPLRTFLHEFGHQVGAAHPVKSRSGGIMDSTGDGTINGILAYLPENIKQICDKMEEVKSRDCGDFFVRPSTSPTSSPSLVPSVVPSLSPSSSPTTVPSANPTSSPTSPVTSLSDSPSKSPSSKPTKEKQECLLSNILFDGHDIENGLFTQVQSVKLCQQYCQAEPDCFYFSFIGRFQMCKLKDSKAPKQSRDISGWIMDFGVVSGPKRC